MQAEFISCTSLLSLNTRLGFKEPFIKQMTIITSCQTPYATKIIVKHIPHKRRNYLADKLKPLAVFPFLVSNIPLALDRFPS
jgi:hypothetical protein